ncbi:ImpA family type VI secretion system protein [Rouxiella sp. Mn2063]|uniref:type VI secretion system protein TssA n=1 Tax=Rouxiella sp. Mn2063 TaxID=3395262 RepID=UPI003BCA332A
MSEGTTTQTSNYYQHALQAIHVEMPCGESLEYDADFIMLQSKLQPKHDVEYGSFVETAEPVNWTEIEHDAFKIFKKCKDIRLIIILMRCRLRQVGILALHEGLLTLKSLLDIYPNDLHPQLVDEGEFEPLMRANAFAELDDASGFLADFRNQLLPKASGLQISIRDFEKATSTPREENALSDTTLSSLLYEWNEHNEKDVISLNHSYHILLDIKECLIETLREDAPDFIKLGNILRFFSREENIPSPEHANYEVVNTASENKDVVIEERIEASISDENINHIVTERKASPKECRKIVNRDDAISRMKEVRSWFTTMEPSSPIIPLLELAENSAGKSFSQLLKKFPLEIVSNLYFEEE